MSSYTELQALVESAERYGCDETLFNYALSRGLSASTHASLEAWTKEKGPYRPDIGLEEMKESLFDRLKHRVEDSYTNIAARWRRHKERKERKGISDAGVVYPKVTPSEVDDFRHDGDKFVSILLATLEGFNPTVLAKAQGLSSYLDMIQGKLTSPPGVVGNPRVQADKKHLTFDGFDATHIPLDHYAARDIGESVNGWSPDKLKSFRDSIQVQIEKILYLMKRTVGRVNSISYDFVDEHPLLINAIDAVQFTLRLVRTMFNQWLANMARVHLYSV